MTAEGETAPIDVPIHSQLSALLFCEFNFYTACVEVAFFTSAQLAPKWFFNFCPSWSEVGFFTSNQLGRKSFFIPDKLSGSWFWKFCPTWAELFFAIFIEAVLKMPFSAATTGRDFFWDHSPKRQSHRLPLGEASWKAEDEARIKSLVSAATIWEGLWTKSVSRRLPLGRVTTKHLCDYE